jgi:cell division protein FtsW
MTSKPMGKVTSITELRAAIMRSESRSQATNRLITTLLLVLVALVVIGIPATISATSTVGFQEEADRYYYLKRQLAGLGLGTIALIVAARVPYHWYRRLAAPLFLVTLGLLVLVLRIGVTANGATSWLDLGPINFQPTELAKFGVIVALSAALERKAGSIDDLGHYLAPVAAYVGTVAFLVMRQPDLGGVIIIGAVAVAVLLVSTAPVRYVVSTALGGVLLALAVSLRGYRLERLTGFLDPWADQGDTGWQLIQSYYALGTGGLFGTGLGNSRARWFYLPNAHTDFIFAILGEETGLIGGLVVVCLFALLGVCGWMIANRAADPFGRMLAMGITTWLTFQAIVNLGGVLGVLPITGVTLPFVSYGGTSLAISMGAVGVLVSVAATPGQRRARPRPPTTRRTPARSPVGRGRRA